jgi:hypothetical protein
MPDHRHIMKSQENQLTELWKKMGFTIEDFKWSVKALPNFYYETFADSLQFQRADFYFDIESVPGFEAKYNYSFKPGQESLIQSAVEKEWSLILENFAIWLKCLKREIDEPSIWDLLMEQRAVLSIQSLEGIPDEKMSDDEVEQIKERLDRLENEMNKRFDLNDEQNAKMHHAIEFLVVESKKQRRRAFVGTFIGTITTIAGLFPRESGMWVGFVTLIKENFGNFVEYVQQIRLT